MSYPPIPEVEVFGITLSRLGFNETVSYIDSLVATSQPAFFITAPLHYAMLCRRIPKLDAVNKSAAFVVADGMPLVWLSRIKGRPIAERVAGSDLVPALCEIAAKKRGAVFLLGAAPGVGNRAAEILCHRYPGLRIAGVECPRMNDLTAEAEADLVDRIKKSNADFLFFARGQPDGEMWLANRYRDLGCVSVQIGASLDFIAGGVDRAPVWMQKAGLEWVYRMLKEPRRLFLRYARNAAFLITHAPREFLSKPEMTET